MLFHSFDIYESSLDGPYFRPKIKNTQLKVISNREELDDYASKGYRFDLMKGGLDRLKWKTGNGSILFGVFVEKELAGVMWLCLEERARNKVDRFPIPVNWETEAVMGGGRTIDKYRRRGLYDYYLSELFKYAKGLGKDRIKSCVLMRDSLFHVYIPHHQLLKLGSKVIGSGYHMRIIRDIWISIIKGDIQINVYRDRNRKF